jgi:heme exporter protein A
MLAVDQLTCRRGLTNLFSHLNLTLNAGEMIYLKGANGSGKTSLLRIIAGLSRPEAGTISWHGADIELAREDYISKLLYIGHAPAVKEELTVAENLLTSLRIAGILATNAMVNQALSGVGLNKRKSLPTRVLSQGQKKRLALARLALDDRPLWILDEPFNALDIEAIRWLEAQLENHLFEGGMVILTSHQAPKINPKRVKELNLSA